METKVMLIVLDGWGIGKNYAGNAIKKAKPKFFEFLWKTFPHSKLKASGNSVGLPEKTIGNSEVGHLHLGAGRIVWQPLELINRAIKNKTFFENKALLQATENVKKNNSTLHLFGLLSDAGVHSHINHLFALIDLAEKQKIGKVRIHCFLDGRDVGEKTALKYIKMLEKKTSNCKTCKITSIIGRFYAMDRDKNWNRTKKAYDLMVFGKGMKELNPLKAVKKAYELGDKTDYYVRPILLDENSLIKKNDSIIFFNFRSDRARQLSRAFTQKKFSKFKVKKLKIFFCGLSQYDKRIPMKIAFMQEKVKQNLGRMLAKNNKKQLRVAETEKYAHITYFFNSQVEKPEKNEERILVPSLKVKSYAEKPEMSAKQITETVLKKIQEKEYDFVLVNYANADLVGHSGEIRAVIKAIKVLDSCLKKIVLNAQKKGFNVIVTADHGNAEEMLYANGKNKPSHTTNKVPFILCNKNLETKKKGQLIDVAPTILQILKLKIPSEMQGKNLLKKKKTKKGLTLSLK